MKKHLIVGPPGTGKTTRLIRIVSECLQRGVKPNRIAYLSFTRAAAEEAISRAVEQFKLDRSDFPWFTTLHALAFRLKALRSDDVMDEAQWELFGNEYGWEFTTDRSRSREARGNELRRVYGLARSRCLPVERIMRDADTKEEPSTVHKFTKQLQGYKTEHTLLDFHDFLDNLDYALPVEVLILDEAQDLTRQQWNLVEKLQRNAEQVFVAGDDDQAIYEWNGADPEAFLTLDATREVLPYSHRLADNIVKAADAVVSPIVARVPKVWRGRAEPARLEFLEPGSVDLGEGEWLLLGRSVQHVWRLLQMVKNTGRMWVHDEDGPHKTLAAKAIVAYTKMSKGERLGHVQWGWVARAVQGATLLGTESGKAVTWLDVKWPFEGVPPWYEACTGISLAERTFFRAVLRRGEKIDRPGELRVSTIHGAKGWESDNVYLWNEGIQKDLISDAERRTWYVGLTRSRSRLVIGGGRPSSVLRNLERNQ